MPYLGSSRLFGSGLTLNPRRNENQIKAVKINSDMMPQMVWTIVVSCRIHRPLVVTGAGVPCRQALRYTHTRAGGMFIQMRSDASTEKPPSRLGNGDATE
jgi:hypothetical protein